MLDFGTVCILLLSKHSYHRSSSRQWIQQLAEECTLWMFFRRRRKDELMGFDLEEIPENTDDVESIRINENIGGSERHSRRRKKYLFIKTLYAQETR